MNREQIEKQLRTVTTRGQVAFAARCAMRAMPIVQQSGLKFEHKLTIEHAVVLAGEFFDLCLRQESVS